MVLHIPSPRIGIAAGSSDGRHATTNEDALDQMATIMEAELPLAERPRRADRQAKLQEHTSVEAPCRAINLDSWLLNLLDVTREVVNVGGTRTGVPSTSGEHAALMFHPLDGVCISSKGKICHRWGPSCGRHRRAPVLDQDPPLPGSSAEAILDGFGCQLRPTQTRGGALCPPMRPQQPLLSDMPMLGWDGTRSIRIWPTWPICAP